MAETKKQQLAVFDFDGTLVDCQSGVQIFRYLNKKGLIKKNTSIRLAWWGLKFKMHLLKTQEKSHKLIFKSFTGQQAEEVDAYFVDLFDKSIDPKIKDEILSIVYEHQKNGVEPVILSASFWSLINVFCKKYGIKYFVATSMERDENNNYTGNLSSESVDGIQKVEQLEQYCNKEFGEGNWEIAYAYADHFSDKKILEQAQNSVAVDPDWSLKRYAKRHGWTIIEDKQRRISHD